MGVPLRVLIIEDSEDDTLILVRELKRAGYDVEFNRVDNPTALKSSLTCEEWDLVVSDFSMPTFSGTDALKLVRSLGCDVPFIFVSGTMGEDTAVAALKDGAQDYLVKTNLKRLVPAVQRELREAEERRRRQTLEQHVNQLQKFEAIGRLAGGIAHDFNNLLSVILGQSEILLERSHDQGITRGLEMIRESARRGASLTRQLLAFARRQVLKPRIVNVNSILADVEKLLKRMIGEDIQLNFQADGRLGNVEVDPAQLEQVIINLATNARDAMPGGGKLTITTTNVILDEPYAASSMVVNAGRYVQITVSDTGCGMDEKTRSRIFEPFFTTKEQGKGTGLGLATVFGIVKQSGGYIWVYSQPGHGTSFKIYLPTVDVAEETLHSVEDVEEPPRGAETVLVVEDDAMLREVTSDFLQSSGYIVLSAGSPKEALQFAEEQNPAIDLLVTDLIMPEMNGRELANRLSKARPKLKVLYVSGYTDGIVQDGSHVTSEGGDAFLEKPYSRRSLARKVREILDLQRIKGSGQNDANSALEDKPNA
jgi:two-component system, cell cycle sensor histidine kinase and response regulator CckA